MLTNDWHRFYLALILLYKWSRLTGYPLLVTQISRTFQEPRSILQWPCRTSAKFKYKDEQQLLWDPGRSPGRQWFLEYTDKICANFRKFWHLHHRVRLPHHSLEHSRTFQDLSHQFPGPKPFFRTSQGLEILQKEIQDFPGLSRRRRTLG